MHGVSIVLALLLLVSVFVFGREHESSTLTVVLSSPYDEVLKVVSEVAASGIVRGSAEYTKESSISGAQAGGPGHLFGRWSGLGQAIYKSRTDVLSPSHFIDSNDSGTVEVRYIVQAVDAGSTRIIVDAVFVESSRRRRHPSDGTVEVDELGDIQQRLRQYHSLKLAAKQREEAETLSRMQQRAEQEKQELDQLLGDTDLLRQRAQALRRELLARIKSFTQLREGPFSQAALLRPLPQGEIVSVLISTPHWHYVRDSQGKEGWVESFALEKSP